MSPVGRLCGFSWMAIPSMTEGSSPGEDYGVDDLLLHRRLIAPKPVPPASRSTKALYVNSPIRKRRLLHMESALAPPSGDDTAALHNR